MNEIMHPPEPFKIKMTEPIRLLPREERYEKLKSAHYNLFFLRSQDVFIDLLTDSGTGAMSQEQWSAMLLGDEAYAGARSWEEFYEVAYDLTGCEHIFPVHQGRAAERIVFSVVKPAGKIFISNGHFDTTRANIESRGGIAVDVPDDNAPTPFKGNLNISKAEEIIKENRDKIGGLILTLTNNTFGGVPVSLENIKQTYELARKYNLPLYMDIARIAENVYFIWKYELNEEGDDLWAIGKEICRYADVLMMSAKKDGLVNMGGMLCVRDDALAEQIKIDLILGEGFPTYGGLAGRDLSALAVGLREAFQLPYLEYRIGQVRYLWHNLKKIGIPVLEPHGGHAVYVDALKMYPDIPPERFPGQVLACMLYLEGGIRTVEIGSVMFGKEEDGRFIPAPKELVRLAIPRRIYTQSHMDHVVRVFKQVKDAEPFCKGFRIIKAMPYLRHFTAHFEPIE